MVVSNVIQLELLEQNEDDAHLKVNDIVARGIEGRLLSRQLYTVTGNVVVTDTQYNEAYFHHLKGSPGSAFFVSFPTRRGVFVVFNDTDEVATVETLSAATDRIDVEMPVGETKCFYSDGTDIIELMGMFYDVEAFVGGAPSVGALMLQFITIRPFTVLADAPGSQGFAGAAATDQSDLDLRKNGGSFGTMRFAISGTVATFVSVTKTSFAAGDRLELIAPSPADATLADVTLGLRCVRP